MTKVDDGQVSAGAAEVYDSFFVPALFAQWTDPVLDAVGAAPGDSVLDVGCGSGVLARSALERVGDHGSVVGIDPNEGMLAVARRAAPGVRWQAGTAEELPFDDGSFDRVVSQFALMFFADPVAGLREMARVARPDGTVAVAVWSSLPDNPGYAALAGLIEELFGSAAADAIRSPFEMGDPDRLRGLAAAALADPVVARHEGLARFTSMRSWLHTEIRGWTLADVIDDAGFDLLLSRAEDDLGDLVDVGGRMAFPVAALILSAEASG